MVGHEPEDAEHAGPGGFEGGQGVLGELLGFLKETIHGSLNVLVFELLFPDLDPLGIVLLHVGNAVFPELGHVGYERQDLFDQRRRDQQKTSRDDEHEHAIKGNDRAQSFQIQFFLQQLDDGSHDQRHDAGDRERPQHAGEMSDEEREDDEYAHEQCDGAHQSHQPEREADQTSLAGSQ